MPRNPYNKSCNPCRERHVRCDRLRPSCSNCKSSKYFVKCNYDPVKFKFRTCLLDPSQKRGDRKRISSSPEQQLSSPHAQNGSAGSSPGEVQGDLQTSGSSCEHVPSASCQGLAAETCDLPQVLGSLSTYPPSQSLHVTPADSSSSALAIEYTEDCSVNQPPTATIVSTPSLSSSTVLAGNCHVISDETESFIYSFYLQTAGPWLDIVSPNRFFGIHVPLLAASEPALRSACLAYASQVLYLHGRVPLQLKDDLHDRALRQLTPMLTSCHQTQLIDPIHAATVLLRMTEQFLELGEDHQHHLYGSSTLFETSFHDWSFVDDKMSSSSFWAYVRGTIRISFLLETPSPLGLDQLSVLERKSKETNRTDEAYTNIMTYLMAELCSICWSKPQSPSSNADIASNLKRLEQAIYEWRDSLPLSFKPWYVNFGEDDTFPDVRYLAPWHCVAWQFFYTAQIMLAVYSPTTREKSNMFQFTRHLEESIAVPTRWLCGITSSCSDYGVKINGSHLVAWSGQFVIARTEQSMILNMLLSLWEETRWPNKTCCARLKSLWNGSRQHWVNEAPGK